jgi:hypothetical protein
VRVCLVAHAHGRGQEYIEISGGKYEEKRPLGRCTRKWEGSVKMELTEIGWRKRDWIHLAQDLDQ